MLGGMGVKCSGALKNASHLGQKDARDKRAREKHPSPWTKGLGGNDGRKREGRHSRQVVLLSQSFPGWICVGIRHHLPLTRINDFATTYSEYRNGWGGDTNLVLEKGFDGGLPQESDHLLSDSSCVFGMRDAAETRGYTIDPKHGPGYW
jgi:hypothetical protein